MMRRSNPFREFDELFNRMSRQFEEMRDFEFSHGLELDIADYDDELVVMIDLPGYDREDIDLSLADQSLTVSATHDVDTDQESGDFIRRERHHETVRRTVALPVEVVEDETSATYQNGVLTVTLPKVVPGADEEDDAHHIDVN